MMDSAHLKVHVSFGYCPCSVNQPIVIVQITEKNLCKMHKKVKNSLVSTNILALLLKVAQTFNHWLSYKHGNDFNELILVS